jgi:hypothetical protein
MRVGVCLGVILQLKVGIVVGSSAPGQCRRCRQLGLRREDTGKASVELVRVNGVEAADVDDEPDLVI